MSTLAGTRAGTLARAELVVPLPMLVREHETDFADSVAEFEAYAHLFPPDDARVAGLLAGYLLILGIGDIIYLYSPHRQSQNRFQDFRAVAEGLRVQFYWRLAGLAHSAAVYYLRKQKDELVWIRDAIRAWSVRAAPR